MKKIPEKPSEKEQKRPEKLSKLGAARLMGIKIADIVDKRAVLK